MNRLLATGLVAAVLALHPGAAYSQEAADPRGAVMCVWMIYASIKQIGDECAPEDQEFSTFLESRIARIEEFILRNSDWNQAGLEERKARFREAAPPDACRPGGEAMRMYKGFKERDRKLIDENLDKLLEVERPPVWNPCL